MFKELEKFILPIILFILGIICILFSIISLVLLPKIFEVEIPKNEITESSFIKNLLNPLSSSIGLLPILSFLAGIALIVSSIICFYNQIS